MSISEMVLTEEWWKEDVYSQPGDPCNKEQRKRRLYALRYSMGQDEGTEWKS